MEDSLNLRDQNLDSQKCTFCAKMSYAGCPGPSPAILAQFILKMCVAAENRKKITKNPYFCLLYTSDAADE